VEQLEFMFKFTSLDFCLRGHMNVFVCTENKKKKTDSHTSGRSPHRRPQRITPGNMLRSIVEWTPNLYLRVNHTTHTLNEFSQYKQFSASFLVVPDLKGTVYDVHKITVIYQQTYGIKPRGTPYSKN